MLSRRAFLVGSAAVLVLAGDTPMLARRLLLGGLGGGGAFHMPAATYLNVKDFGALGNGSADDTSAAIAAMAATPAMGTLVFPTGAYKITARLTRSDAAGPINLLGAGSESGGTIIRQVTANTDAFGSDVDILTSYSSTGADNNKNYDRASTISCLRIEGPTGGSGGAGVYGLSDVNLYDVGIYGFHDGYFLDSKSYYARAIGCKFARATNAAILNYGYNQTLFDCQVWNSDYGIYLSGNQSVRVRDCVFEQNATAGLYYDGAVRSPLTAPPSGLLVSGCYFEETASGVPDIKIGATTAVSDVVIENNIFIANAQGDTGASWHIDFYKADRVTISTNTLTGGGTGGGDIRCSGDTTHLVLLNQRYVTASGLPGGVTVVG
jgi:hypothetical protein